MREFIDPDTPRALDLLADALACHRITRLIHEDTVFDRPRDAAKQWLHDEGHTKVLELAGCPWCISVYVAVGVVAARRLVPRAWAPAARALAVSSVAGIISSFT